MKTIYDDVCEYEKVRLHLEQHPEHKEKIIEMVDEIKGDYRFGVVGAAAKFIDKTFMRLYDGVNLDIPPEFDINELQKKYHIILVPNHQSHADYIALQYILFKWFKAAVYIAAGINLNIFPVGSLFKRCGAFFIRRRFDDEIYKIAFQGYIYHLLKSDKMVEFFFEGGRTRTGKLLPPKFGLFSMLLDAHTKFGVNKKPLMFIPVSIAHEMIPEERAHAKELSGAKKEREKTTQLLKIFKLANKKLGTVHVAFSNGIIVDELKGDLKTETQNLAFDCFRAVGRRMPITPSSLLAMVMLDDPAGALTWRQIEDRSTAIVEYCKFMGIPITKSLSSDKISASLKVAMDMFINNKKAELIKREKLNQVFYTINDESRIHLLYNKNMILHHFIVPGIMNATLFNIFNGKIKDAQGLTRFLMTKRNELKHEFYLPKVREMINEALRVIEYSIGEKLENLADALEFTNERLYQIASSISKFSTGFSYLYEAYYISSISLKFIGDKSFKEDKFIAVSKELFEMEREHGKVVKYPESFNVPIMRNTLKYYLHLDLITKDEDGIYQIINSKKIYDLSEKFASDVNDQVALNLKFVR